MQPTAVIITTVVETRLGGHQSLSEARGNWVGGGVSWTIRLLSERQTGWEGEGGATSV